MEPDGSALIMQKAGTALLVIDMLNDFLMGPFAAPQARRLIEPVRKAVDRARTAGIPVIFVCDAHSPDDDEFAVLAPHAIAGTDGAKIVEELAPQNGDIIVEKTRYSGFFETELAARLQALGVSTIALCGCQTDCCVMHTAADGFFRGFRPVLLDDATAARTEEGHRNALASMKRLYGANAISYRDLSL